MLFDPANTKTKAATKAAVRQIDAWARSSGVPDGCVLTVAEISCTDPGCVPLETVITLLGPDEWAQIAKVLKEAVDVSEAEATAAGSAVFDAWLAEKSTEREDRGAGGFMAEEASAQARGGGAPLIPAASAAGDGSPASHLPSAPDDQVSASAAAVAVAAVGPAPLPVRKGPTPTPLSLTSAPRGGGGALLRSERDGGPGGYSGALRHPEKCSCCDPDSTALIIDSALML